MKQRPIPKPKDPNPKNNGNYENYDRPKGYVTKNDYPSRPVKE